jgi:PEGA domain
VGVVLAIDPGRRLSKTVSRLTTDLRGHEIIVATSGDEALSLLEARVPDLVLFPLFLSPGDESKLQSRLDGLSNPAEIRALTLPLRSFFDGEPLASRPAAVPPRWFYWFKPAVPVGYSVHDARAFAARIRSELGRPHSPGTDAAVPVESWASPPLPPAPVVPSPFQAPAPWPLVGEALPGPGRPDFDSLRDAMSAQVPVPQRLAPPPTAPSPSAPSLPPPSPAARGLGLSAPLESTTQTDELEPSGASTMARGALSRLQSGIAAGWRVAGSMPRAAWVAAPVVIILLTLGATGRAGALFGAPVRMAMAVKERLFPTKAKTGTAEIQSVPDGAQVWLNGRQIGVTPMQAEFAVGSHEVELRHRGVTRSLILDILPGATVVQRIEWAAARGASGRLQVESDPPGASVTIDGQSRGVTPLTADELTVGRHTVDLTLNGNTVRETVDIKSGKTTTLHSSIYQGWLALFAAVEIDGSVDGRALVLDDQNRALLPAGHHTLTLRNKKLGFFETRSIEIKPGETTAVSVELPKSALTVTASGPAEVWLDGIRLGDSPIVDLPIEVGTHDVSVRSAEYGERRIAITATLDPIRVSVDFQAAVP